MIHNSALGGTGEIVALPLTYGETRYGVLTVYGPECGLFDERELAVLGVLARATSTAINAVEGRKLLTADSVVELDLSITDEGLFYRDIAATVDATLTYEGTIDTGTGIRMLFVAEGVDADAISAAGLDHPDVDGVTVLSADDGTVVVEFEVASPPVVDLLADHGAETTAIEAADGSVHLTVELPAGADTRAVIDGLAERYPSVDLLARRERERSAETRAELVSDINGRLTGRQRLALQKAYLGGFFDWPRETSGEELAASMDISPSTYHQHLRTAERKVFDALFED
jgi:predicted DNA binding protein